MADERLTDDEVAAVLRRAADLDGGAAAPTLDGLPVAAVEAAAAEAGLSPAAVRHAVAELRAGALEDDGLTAPGVVVCARVVPGTPDGTLASVGRYLSHQALVRARDRGREQVWRPRDDVVATLRRKLDFTGSIRLRAVDEVVVRAVEVEGGTLVRVVARLDAVSASAPSIGAGVGSTLGTAAAGAAAALTGDAAWLLATAAGAPAAGVLGWRIGRGVRGERRRNVAEAIDGMLDELELGRGTGRWERAGRHLRRVYRL
jgi:hypothetical protein